MRIQQGSKNRNSQSGMMLAVIAVALVAMAGLTVVVLRVSGSSRNAQRQDGENAHARYVAQAGLANAMFNLQSGHTGALGSEQAPVLWDRSRYYVTQQNVTADILKLTATGLDDRAAARQELVVRVLPTTIWRFGAFGRDYLDMASNARVDSYNSGNGSYAAQATHGSGSNMYANTNGDVGSNGDILLDQNSKIWGDAIPGPSHMATVLGNAFVTGSTTPATAPIELPALSVPTYQNFGALTVTGTTTIPAGNRAYTNLTVNASKRLNIVGPANVVISNLNCKSGGLISIDATHGPVTLWVVDNFVLSQNAQIAPTDLQGTHILLNLLSDNVINPNLNSQLDTVSFESNSKFYGRLYAPSAAININSDFELFGSMIARSVNLRSNASFHFDEALLNSTGTGEPTFETISWREVPYAQP